MTITEQDLTHISFHEATLTDIVRRGSTVSLTLEDVSVADVQMAAKVTVEGVVTVSRDRIPVVHLQMEEEDGEILTLRKENNQVFLAVEWNSFSSKRQKTVVYTLDGPQVTLRITSFV